MVWHFWDWHWVWAFCFGAAAGAAQARGVGGRVNGSPAERACKISTAAIIWPRSSKASILRADRRVVAPWARSTRRNWKKKQAMVAPAARALVFCIFNARSARPVEADLFVG